jgi:hypothetical protein
VVLGFWLIQKAELNGDGSTKRRVMQPIGTNYALYNLRRPLSCMDQCTEYVIETPRCYENALISC